jgi:hypothetical protein
MNERQNIIGGLIIYFNIGWLCCAVLCVYLAMRFAWIRNFIKQGLENGDGIGHHEDLTKAIINSIAICISWVFINTVLASIFFIPDATWYTTEGIVGGILLGLLGLKKL